MKNVLCKDSYSDYTIIQLYHNSTKLHIENVNMSSYYQVRAFSEDLELFPSRSFVYNSISSVYLKL